jgi:hypothetical protein
MEAVIVILKCKCATYLCNPSTVACLHGNAYAACRFFVNNRFLQDNTMPLQLPDTAK